MRYLYKLATQASMVTAVLLICSAIAQGQSRTISHNTDTQSYVLTYDEQRLRGFDMGQIVWLSPWYDPDAPSPYFMGRSESGQPPRPDKGFYAAPLEFGTSKVRVWDAETFEARAQQNLLKAAHDVDTLRSLKLPSVLEPVRAYLLEGLQFSLKIQELRSGYIKTGNVEPLRGALCKVCACDLASESILRSLQEATSFDARREQSFRDWPNAMLQCYTSRHPEYPLSSWQAFLTKNGITEEVRGKSPE